MSAPDPPPPRMLGDLPLIPASRFDAVSDNYWSERGMDGLHWFNAGREMEFLQRLLYADQKEVCDVDLDTRHRLAKWLWRYCKTIGYHPDLQPHWERYADAKANEIAGMELFLIRDIYLPPAPFFSDKLAPVLQKHNDSLVRLELVKCGLKSDGFGCVADFLTDNASVATLDLSRNNIEDAEDAKFLALAIWNHPELQCVNLSKCGLGKTKGVLAEVMGGAGNLETLLLEENAICSEGMALVAEFLESNTTTTTLSLADNYFRKMSSYYYRPELREEDERIYATFVDNAVAIGEALKKNTSIRQLSLRKVHGMEVPTFLDSKRATELLTHLDLSMNRIGKEGGEMIADYLERNPVLIELNLESNGIGSSSATLFAEALKANDTLEHLSLRYNSFNDKSVPSFVDMLRNNTTILSLNLANNNIKVKTGRKEMLKAICDTSSLDALVLESNHKCSLRLTASKAKGTPETVLRSINALEDEGEKIRYKVVLALFAMDSDLFSPWSFDNVPLELMPRLLHLVQQEIGYGGFGEGVVETTRQRRLNGFDPTLRRMHEVLSGWNQLPLLFVRGPGILKKKRKRKRHVMSFKEDEDEEWTPRSR